MEVLTPLTALMSHVTNKVVYDCMAWELDRTLFRVIVAFVVVVIDDNVVVVIVIDMEQVVVVPVGQLEWYTVVDSESVPRQLFVGRMHGKLAPFL